MMPIVTGKVYFRPTMSPVAQCERADGAPGKPAAWVAKLQQRGSVIALEEKRGEKGARVACRKSYHSKTVQKKTEMTRFSSA
jgi:hypothetical protein